jgi:hypothetical protein
VTDVFGGVFSTANEPLKNDGNESGDDSNQSSTNEEHLASFVMDLGSPCGGFGHLAS